MGDTPLAEVLPFAELLERAAFVIRMHADELRLAHTLNGRWPAGEDEVREHFDELASLADRLGKSAKYHRPNPLGGPAVVFDACADAIRAGDSIDSAMADYRLAWRGERGMNQPNPKTPEADLGSSVSKTVPEVKAKKPKKPPPQYFPPGHRPGPLEVVQKAIELFKPVAIYAGFSGGNDSRAAVDWSMKNVLGCGLLHINTGIGSEITRRWVRATSAAYGFYLTEIRAKEDCGQDYRKIVLKHGFPGPDGHQYMYSLLKERCIRLLVKRAKLGHPRRANVMILTGVRHDESVRRMGYGGMEINKIGSQVWVNPIYWWSKAERDAYNAASGMPENPVCAVLGMSGECGCGAFAHPGELAQWRAADPDFADEIEALQAEVLARGFTWNWEGRPPKGGHNAAQGSLDLPQMPLCTNCVKSAIVQEAMAEVGL